MSKIAGANGRSVRGRGDAGPLSATRASPDTSDRASTSTAASPGGSTSRRRWARRTSTTGAPSRSPTSPIAARSTSIVANQNQPAVLYRDYPDSTNHWIALQARRHAQQSQRDRRRGGDRGGRSHAAACRRRRVGIRESERSAAALRARAARMGGSRRHPLAVGHDSSISSDRRSNQFVTVTEPRALDMTDATPLAAADRPVRHALWARTSTDRSALSHRVPHHARARRGAVPLSHRSAATIGSRSLSGRAWRPRRCSPGSIAARS